MKTSLIIKRYLKPNTYIEVVEKKSNKFKITILYKKPIIKYWKNLEIDSKVKYLGRQIYFPEKSLKGHYRYIVINDLKTHRILILYLKNKKKHYILN